MLHQGGLRSGGVFGSPTFSGTVTAAGFVATTGGITVPTGGGITLTGQLTGMTMSFGSGNINFVSNGTTVGNFLGTGTFSAAFSVTAGGDISTTGGRISSRNASGGFTFGIAGTEYMGMAAGSNIVNVGNGGFLSLIDFTGTAGSGTGIATNKTCQVASSMNKITVGFTAVQTAATTKDVTIWTLPAKTRVIRVIADVTTKFIGGAIATCTMTCGNSAGGNQYLLSFDVFTAATTKGMSQADLGAGVVGGTGFSADMNWASTQAVQCRFTSTGANLSALTQGSVTFYIETTNFGI